MISGENEERRKVETIQKPVGKELLEPSKKYKFTEFEQAKFPGFSSKEIQDLLFKWGMQDHCYIKRFTFDQAFKEYELDQFLVAFFHQNPCIKVLGSQDRWGTLGNVDKIEKEETLHSVTSLSFFDRLKNGIIYFLTTDDKIIRFNGDIVKCLDEYYDSFLISDQLRKCLLMPEFEEYDIFSALDRKEFIFSIFKSLCLGGRLCQVIIFITGSMKMNLNLI
jgi:cilia- and flagella-associated protein 300